MSRARERNAPRGRQSVKADEPGLLCLVELQHGARAENAVPHALAGPEGGGVRAAAQRAFAHGNVAAGVIQQHVIALAALLQKAGGDVEQKARGIAVGSVKIASGGLGEVQPLLRARHCDEGQPPLLLHGGEGPDLFEGEQSLVHRAQEHMGEFQPLGRVHGHQLHAVAAVARVGVCKQGHMGQIVLERAFSPHVVSYS